MERVASVNIEVEKGFFFCRNLAPEERARAGRIRQGKCSVTYLFSNCRLALKRSNMQPKRAKLSVSEESLTYRSRDFYLFESWF